MEEQETAKGKGRLLIVDDEECIQDILKRHFSREGYDCRSAGNIESARGLLRAFDFDLVMTDIMMPGESGLTLLKSIKTQSPETSVVMITAISDTQVAIDAVKMGACDYITKPIDLGNTQVLVEQALRRRELVLENSRYRGYLENLFQRYVSPEMLAYVLRDHPLEDMQSRILEATVLFCDIRGFSSLYRAMEPMELIPRLNKHYFEPATHIIMSKRGTVNKFIGDGIMAVFGAPLPYEGHADCAVEAARSIIRDLHRPPSQAGDRFPLGIGIATGKVLSGNIGGMKRMDYTVMGEAVNVAAQLEKSAGPGEILLNPEAYKALSEKAAGEPVQVSLKAHEGPATVFRLGGQP